MPGCPCNKENFLAAYNDEVATTKLANPTWDDHVVRLRVAEVVRPRFKADMDAGKAEASDEEERDVKDEFTVTPDGRAKWIGYGRYMDELDERTSSLTPKQYDASDRGTTTAIELALHAGARRIVTSYARPGHDNRDLLVITYDPETNRGTMKIIKTATNGNLHDFESMQNAARERFANLELNRTSQTTFLLTDIKLPQDQTAIIRPDAQRPAVAQQVDHPLYYRDDQKIPLSTDHIRPFIERGNLLGQTLDTAGYAGRQTVAEVGITVKRVREAMQEAVAKQRNSKTAKIELSKQLSLKKDRVAGQKIIELEKKDQKNRLRNNHVFEGNKARDSIILKKSIGKKDVIFAWKQQKESVRQLSPEIIFRTGQKQKGPERKKQVRRNMRALLTEKVLLGKEPIRNKRMKKGRLLAGERKDRHVYLKKITKEKNKSRTELNVIRQHAREGRTHRRKIEIKRTHIFREALVRLAQQINRRKEMKARHKQSGEIMNMKKERHGALRNELRNNKNTREKKHIVLLQLSFAWMLWMLLKTERNFIRPPIALRPGFGGELRHTVQGEPQGMTLKKQDEADHENNPFIKHESTQWVLLSIIWYLTMIREAGKQSSNQQAAQSSHQQLPRFFTPVFPIHQQGVIFAFSS